jgi:tRNA-5-methyluridine54 2-sulfurtransferase
MKCKVCKGEATIKLVSYNANFCERDFLTFFERRISNAIKDYKMFSHSERILLAASGGKDSLALWDVLARLGYNVTGYHLELGIPDSSDAALALCREFAEKKKGELIVDKLSDILNGDIIEASRAMKKPACSVCGMIKRYRFNRLAEEKGFDVVVTGHPLDDESAALLGNVLHWQQGYLAHQYPMLEKRPGMVRKAKPMVYVSKKEIEIYARVREINFASSDCPYAAGATSNYYKQAMNQLEEQMPSTKIFFLKTFFAKFRGHFKEDRLDSPGALHPCPECGYLTVADLCNFCFLKKKLAGRKLKKAKSDDSAQAASPRN